LVTPITNSINSRKFLYYTIVSLSNKRRKLREGSNLEYTTILDIIGTVAFALSGYILASKAKFDILGVIVISLITAFGGGVVRDLLVDKTPFIFKETYPIAVAMITIFIAYILKLHHNIKLSRNYIFRVSDSIGLSLFAYTGAITALSAEFNFSGILFLSFLTAVGGGIIRDMMMNKVPFVLTNDFYGTVALLIGLSVWILSLFDAINTYSSLIILVIGTIIRLIAIKKRWKLPKLF